MTCYFEQDYLFSEINFLEQVDSFFETRSLRLLTSVQKFSSICKAVLRDIQQI